MSFLKIEGTRNAIPILVKAPNDSELFAHEMSQILLKEMTRESEKSSDNLRNMHMMILVSCSKQLESRKLD